MNHLSFPTGLALLCFISLTFSACRKSEKADNIVATDNTLAEAAFNDVYLQVEAAVRSQDSLYRYASSEDIQCANVAISPATGWPKFVTIDFGTGCTGIDERIRKGIIHVELSGRYRDAGTIIKIKPENYYVNNILVEGEKTITNLGTNSAGNLHFGIEVVNGRVTEGDRTISWNSNRQREWVDGSATNLNILDDQYLITGDADGISADGDPFTATITNPLRIQLNCRWITEGTLDLQVSDHPIRSINFGTGNCDNQATITIKKRTYNITLQ